MRGSAVARWSALLVALGVAPTDAAAGAPGADAPKPASRPATEPSAVTRPTSLPSSATRNLESGFDSFADRQAPLLVPNASGDEFDLSLIAEAAGFAATPAAAAAEDDSSVAGAGKAGAKKGEWLIAPLPNHMAEFGWGIVARVGYIFPLDPTDKVSPPSVVAAFGYYSENESWAAGMATKLYMNEDRYRLTAALMHASINYDYFGAGTDAGTAGHSVPLNQEMTGGLFEFLFRVTPGFYVGPRYVGANVHISTEGSDAGLPTPIPANETDTVVSGLGLHAQWDTRDSQFYPRRGYLADLDLSFHEPAIGDDFSYQVYKASYNHYLGLAPNQVLALRAMGQFQSGDVPFFALSKFGRGPDLRGYEIGQFQDKQMLAAQAEYRLMLTKRFGVVGFAGVGEVVPSLGELNAGDLLPSVGAGLRYVIAPQNHVAIRLDGAWGREGGQFYLTVGEAF